MNRNIFFSPDAGEGAGAPSAAASNGTDPVAAVAELSEVTGLLERVAKSGGVRVKAGSSAAEKLKAILQGLGEDANPAASAKPDKVLFLTRLEYQALTPPRQAQFREDGGMISRH